MYTTVGTYCSFLDDCLLSWMDWNLHVPGVSRPIIRRQLYVYNSWYLLFFLDDSIVLDGLESTCSGRIQAHHQEVQPYVYNSWYLLFFLDDSVVLDGLESTCSGRIQAHHQETTVCIQQLVFIILFR